MSTPQLFLVAMLLIFGAPYLLWRLGRTEFWAPLVVVEIVAGVVLGPGVLGAAFPRLYAGIFTPGVMGPLNGIAWWAVMMFVWLAGLELDVKDTWADRKNVATTAMFALGTPFLLGVAAGLLLLHLPGEWRGAAATPAQFVAGVGLACSVTALPILVLLLDKLGMLRAPLGQRILRYASVDDLAVWAVLALILFDWRRVAAQIGFLAGFAMASFVVRALMPRLSTNDRWYVGLLWLVSCALAADWAGLHFMVGGYLAGVVLDVEWFEQERVDRFRDAILLALMPVFFLSTGLKTRWNIHSAAVPLVALLLLVVSAGGKLLGMEVIGRMLGWERSERRMIGWLLQTKALIMIIFVNILLGKGLITAPMFTALLLMAIASTALTIPMVSRYRSTTHATTPGRASAIEIMAVSGATNHTTSSMT